jgi:hypothetical protein
MAGPPVQGKARALPFTLWLSPASCQYNAVAALSRNPQGGRVKQIFEYIQSFVTIGLVLTGIGGVSYYMFRDNGWLEMALGKIWDFQLSNPVIAIPMTIAVLFIGKLWIDKQRAKGYTSKLPNVLVYVVMAAGVYFIYQFIAQGFTL